MAYTDLREFIDALDKAGELKRIPFEVDPRLEMTEFADRSVKTGGPALLFEKPKGSAMPVLLNAFASEKRMRLAMQVDSLEVIAGRISEYLQMRMPEGFLNKLKMLPILAEVGAFFPKIVKDGPCKEVIRKDNFSLRDIPRAALLAAGRRSVYHAADGVLEESGDGQAQLRHVPHAGV